MLTWRSLIRKTFLINGSEGGARAAPNLKLEDVLHLMNALQDGRSSAGGHNGKSLVTYVDPDLDGVENDGSSSLDSDMLEVESIFSSLIEQGLLGGYLSHRQLRFVIKGAKQKGTLAAGFPNIWTTIKERSNDEVPGWKKDTPAANRGGAGKFGPGMVVNLTGAKPVGSR